MKRIGLIVGALLVLITTLSSCVIAPPRPYGYGYHHHWHHHGGYGGHYGHRY